jgi:NAD(P)-dependent dehydrogenase (short-subunit alcohol dehydrogenase family)
VTSDNPMFVQPERGYRDGVQTRGVAVVTGGSAGVGRATVRQLAEAGYDVAVIARGRAGVEAAAEEVRAAGRQALALQVDVADAEAVDKAAERIEVDLGPIEVWVNNAFVGALDYTWDQDPEKFRRITEVTYYGQVHGMLAALRYMRPRDRGSIVNISSSLAHRAIPLQGAYCGAKHAIKGYTESLRVELQATGSKVTVSMVTLPAVNTPQFDWNDDQLGQGHPMPVPPIYQPEVIAKAVVDVARRPRHDVWVGTPAVLSVLGSRLAPAIVDWRLARTGVSSQTTDAELARYGSNLFEAKDDEHDRGARGGFSDQARTIDPVSAIGAVVGRTVGRTVGFGLRTVSAVLDRL